jgi:hypothetical protein
MTIKIRVVVETTDETAKLTVIRERENKEPPFRSDFYAVTGFESPPIDVEVGDRLQVAVEAGHKIVMDSEQSCVRIESLDSVEAKKGREEVEKEEKEKVEEYDREWKARREMATKLKAEKKPVGSVPPLPDDYKTLKEEAAAKEAAHPNAVPKSARVHKEA